MLQMHEDLNDIKDLERKLIIAEVTRTVNVSSVRVRSWHQCR